MVCKLCKEEHHNNLSDKYCSKCMELFDKSKRNIIIGCIFFILGLSFTVMTLIDGTIRVLFYGAILFGFIDTVKGISDYFHLKKIENHPEKYIVKQDINDSEVNEEALNRYLASKRNSKSK